VTAAAFAHPAAPFRREQEPGEKKAAEGEDLSRSEAVRAEEEPETPGEQGIQRKESERRSLARRRRRAVAALENRQVPAGVVARERRRALLDIGRPLIARGDVQQIARGVGPGENQDGPEEEKSGGLG
jgi:hypothetical protein